MTLKEVKKNKLLLEYIKQTERTLKVQGFTEHGLNHANFVASRARTLALETGLPKRDQELSAIAGFCHDMGNFLSRSLHNYLSALSFQQIFVNDFPPEELTVIMQAIANHDRYEIKFLHPVSAILVLADKSDVRRSRVLVKDLKKMKSDIHDRVNYAVKSTKLSVNRRKKIITLNVKIDTNIVPVIEYFEIFTKRMVFCRKAAEYLGYKFGLVINNFKLL